MTRSQITDAYYLEHRAKLIDVAAFLDRLDRAVDEPSGDDYRVRALRESIELLIDGSPNRAERVLKHLSDPTMDPIPAAPGKGASGAFDPSGGTL